MTGGAELTALYHRRVRESGATAAELTGRLPRTEHLTAAYGGGFLSRPLFLGHHEKTALERDLAHWHRALESLPDRLFEGDLAAFARAVGMTEVQVAAVLKGRGERMTRQSRADLHRTADGFKMLECNLGSALGGLDNGEMAAALLEHPVLAGFAAEHRLTHVDTTEVQVANTLLESGYARTDRPVVALADWPSSYQQLAPYNRLLCDRWAGYGLEAHPCHLGELTVRQKRVWLHGRPIDLVVRTFMVEDLLESPGAPALMAPVLEAAEAGWVRIFTPMETEAFTSKGALALLSDERHRGLYDPAELAALDRLLPWTRLVREGRVTLADGERGDLLAHALAHREELALKPTLSHGGRGVLLGWDREMTAERWERAVREAVDGPYLLQRRAEPLPEQFLDDSGEWSDWVVTWGVFSGADGFAGALTRAVPAGSANTVVNVGNGALVSSLLFEREPAV
ncbi:hypothetical protein ACFYNO_00045 [Kitasatospora sp. NPDC006697]|uniref:hypothetical protein n=1 Tax=Kitasatospora sp. NPDC006697 TaxID=3364020 RepID=UPI0036C02955